MKGVVGSFLHHTGIKKRKTVKNEKMKETM